MKFGGTSVDNRERLVRVADIIRQERAQGHDVVVVVSAQGDHTDELLQKAREMADQPPAREMDALLATGEQASSALLAMTLCEQGCPAVSLTARQMGFYTDRGHGAARILRVEPERVRRELKAGNVAVCSGFRGVDDLDDVTTLGRGGSDTSAVALAAALSADVCRIYTDVAGVYTADPRRVPGAHKLSALSFDEMLEMSSLGAQVLLGRAVALAKRYGVTLQVLSSFSAEDGTEVNDMGFEGLLVKGVVQDDDIALVTVRGVPVGGEAAEGLFTLLGEESLAVQHIAASAARRVRRDIAFAVRREQTETALSLVRGLIKKYNIQSVTCDRDVSCVSVVGAGLTGYPDVPGRLFAALGRAGASVKLVSGGDSKLTVIVGRKEAGRAAAAVHKEFIE